MKKLFILMLCAFLGLGIESATAQTTNPDQIVGLYKAVRNGVTSKVKVYKYNGGYRAQVTWVDNLKMPDGSIRLDEKNPDKSKRNTRADQIILIDKVTWDADDKCWKNGKIYDPTKGKSYTTVIDFKDAKTLRVKGYLGPFHESMYWTRIQQ